MLSSGLKKHIFPSRFHRKHTLENINIVSSKVDTHQISNIQQPPAEQEQTSIHVHLLRIVKYMQIYIQWYI